MTADVNERTNKMMISREVSSIMSGSAGSQVLRLETAAATDSTSFELVENKPSGISDSNSSEMMMSVANPFSNSDMMMITAVDKENENQHEMLMKMKPPEVSNLQTKQPPMISLPMSQILDLTEELDENITNAATTVDVGVGIIMPSTGAAAAVSTSAKEDTNSRNKRKKGFSSVHSNSICKSKSTNIENMEISADVKIHDNVNNEQIAPRDQ